jgi:hypothetical protein
MLMLHRQIKNGPVSFVPVSLRKRHLISFFFLSTEIIRSVHRDNLSCSGGDRRNHLSGFCITRSMTL